MLLAKRGAERLERGWDLACIGPGMPLLEPLHQMKFKAFSPLHAQWYGLPAAHDLHRVSRGCDGGRGSGRLGMRPLPSLLIPLPFFLEAWLLT
eukprot:1154097-Pelagomonas_calceolata.AAC.1